MNILDIVNMRGLMALIEEERSEAIESVLEDYPCCYSRGTFLTTEDDSGQCQPRPAANCPEWHRTKKEIDELIILVTSQYPSVKRIVICGGYDGATSPNAYHNDDYEPWAGAWSLVIWKK